MRSVRSRLLWRALIAFVALPGVVAFAIPMYLGMASQGGAAPWVIGLTLVAVGSALLLWCVREFYVAGRGTLAPWAPPQNLVTTGPYRITRNPMYVGVSFILVGWAFYFHSQTLGYYCLAIPVAFHLRVILAEEPWAVRTFGAAWEEYRSRVPRWLI